MPSIVGGPTSINSPECPSQLCPEVWLFYDSRVPKFKTEAVLGGLVKRVSEEVWVVSAKLY